MSKDILEMLNELGVKGDLTKQAYQDSNKPKGDTQPEKETGETKPATTGERDAENSSDVKSQSPGTNVEESKENTDDISDAGENTPTNKQGVKAVSTGKDVPATKDVQEDPGTSHEARTDTEKLSSADDIASLGNELLASLTMLVKSSSVVEDETPARKQEKKSEPKKTEEKKTEKAANDAEVEIDGQTYKVSELAELVEKAASIDEVVGYLVGNQTIDNLEKLSEEDYNNFDDFQKTAADYAVNTYNQASADAEDLFDYMYGFQKASMGELSPEELAMLEAEMGGAPEAVPAAGGEEALMGEMDPEEAELLALIEQNPELLEEVLAEEAAMGGGDMSGEMDPAAMEGEVDPQLLEELIAAIAEEEASGGEMGVEEAPVEEEVDPAMAAKVASVINILQKAKSTAKK